MPDDDLPQTNMFHVKPWWDHALPVLDFETTAPEPDQARIVTVALLAIDGDGDVVSEYEAMADPGVEIPRGASKVHGITTERARTEGQPIRKVLRNTVAFVHKIIEKEYPLVIFNARYDAPLLWHECTRHGVAFNPEGLRFLDPLVIDRALDKYRRGKRTLSKMAKVYGVTLDEAHDARHDAKAAAGILRSMARKFPDLRRITLDDMQMRQRAWFMDWRDHINAYWQRKGLDRKAEGRWPWRNVAPTPVEDAPEPEEAR